MSAPTDTSSYLTRRGEIAHYFDRTAADAWRQLTSDAPLGRIRESVRAGREQMRRTLLDWLPADLTGLSVLDAGCGTGALAVEAARRGARVTAIDLSPTLVELARERLPVDVDAGMIEFVSGDMLAPYLGEFDYAVAMDSLIHYGRRDVAEALAGLAPRVRQGMLFTHVPLTPRLAVKRAVGRLFPRSDRAPDVRPCRFEDLRGDLAGALGGDWTVAEHRRVSSGFYTSQALRLVRGEEAAE
ncbi:MAG: magnesium protoporphyrin IX methyltransferase [Pseudomonadales bacterium]